jgi:hypothetical protein
MASRSFCQKEQPGLSSLLSIARSNCIYCALHRNLMAKQDFEELGFKTEGTAGTGNKSSSQ